MQPLANQKDKFELPEGVNYLNGAFMSPQLRSVTAIGIAALRKKARPFEITKDDFFNDAELIRDAYSSLIANPVHDRIVLIPSVSYGMANVARNINVANKKLIVAGEQFPSNVYPWWSLANEQGGEFVVVDAPDSFEERGQRWNERILDAIDNNTAMVALSHIHWADGTRFDLEAVRVRTREVGALLVVDGTQSVGALPISLEKEAPDALVCAGYKWLLGPYGIGMAWYGEYFDSGSPVEENWINRLHSEDFAGLVDYEERYQQGALRYEVGEHSNFILVPMMLEALKQLNAWGPENIQAYCEEITTAPIDRLREHGYWIEDKQWRSAHLFGIRHKSMPINQIKRTLAAKNISVSYRGSAIRVAPYVHNTIDQMNELAEELIKIIRDA